MVDMSGQLLARKNIMKRFILNFVAIVITAGLLHSAGYAYTQISGSEACEMYSSSKELVIVDVREYYEYCQGHIPCAINYPYNSGVFPEEFDNLPTDIPILVVCASGGRSGAAAGILDTNGYDTVYSLTGGMPSWPDNIIACINTLSGQSPLNTGYTWHHPPEERPIKQTNPADCKPFAVGDLSSGNLNLQVGLPAFSSGVDVYLAIGFSDVLFLIDSSNVLHPASGLAVLPSWKTNVSTDICESLYGDIPISGLPPGLYNLYLAVTPAGGTDFSSYYFWATSFNIGD